MHKKRKPKTLHAVRPNTIVENIFVFLVFSLLIGGVIYSMIEIKKIELKSEKARQTVIQKDKKCRNGCYNKGYPRWDREDNQCWCLNSTKVVRLGE